MSEPIRLLVLDDDEEIIQSFEMLLRMFQGKYEADFFNHPQKALETITQNPRGYDLILTDIQMPEINGVKFVEQVRSFIPNIPIIFMTGFTSEESKRDALARENVVFLEKPFLLREVLTTTIPELMAKQQNTEY